MPKVSVIIPAYKAERFLHRCVDSLINQTFTDFEIILVDDGSPDGSGKICDEYANKYSFIQAFHTENGGVSSARNFGITQAEGEWICFVDSDDWVEGDYLSNFFLYQNSDETLIFQNILFDYGNSITKPFFQYNDIIFDIHAADLISKYKILHNGCPVSKLFRSSIIKDNHIKFDTTISIHEDHCFVFDYLKHIKKIRLIEKITYHYIIHDGSSLTSTMHSSEEWLYASESLFSKIDILTKNWNLTTEYHKSLLSDFSAKQLYSAALNCTSNNYYQIFSRLRHNTTLLMKYKDKSWLFKFIFIAGIFLHLDYILYIIISKRQ